MIIPLLIALAVLVVIVIALGAIFTVVICEAEEREHRAPAMLCWIVFLVCYALLSIITYHLIAL